MGDFSYNEVVKEDKSDTGRTPVSTKPKQKKKFKQNSDVKKKSNFELEKKKSNFEECIIDLSSDSEGEIEEDEEDTSSQQDVFSVAEEAYLIGDDDSDCQIEIYEDPLAANGGNLQGLESGPYEIYLSD